MLHICNADVRPAPHMDSLVNIYKSMEVASGANIFVSQSVPSKKLSGNQLYSNSECSYYFIELVHY